jgi:kumamolisin
MQEGLRVFLPALTSTRAALGIERSRFFEPFLQKAGAHGAFPEPYRIGEPNPKQLLQVTVLVRSRSADGLLARILEAESAGDSLIPYLSRDEFAADYGADPSDLARVEDFAGAHGLSIVETSIVRRSLVLHGTVADISQAFGVELVLYELGAHKYIGCESPPSVAARLAQIIDGVFGLDNRPRCPRGWWGRTEAGPVRNERASSIRTPRDLAQHYRLPSGLGGKGQCVAIIALQGGYAVDDLTQYFAQLGLPAPEASAVSVDGAFNDPLECPYQDRVEVTCDVEVLGAVAPQARLVVYFAPNSERGWLDVLSTAVHDSLRQPSVVSISWGMAEACWTGPALHAMNRVLMEAAALGITVCCAAGSDGFDSGMGDGVPRVEFPASSPWVLACGGTGIELGEDGTAYETVWNDRPGGGCTGGGTSVVFDRPKWQEKIDVPSSVEGTSRLGRGLPDVAGFASGYTARVIGEEVIFKGTSAVAPLWAGLVALLNQHAGRPTGFLNPLLYKRAAAAAALHDVTRGSNGAYPAGPGWDACTGLGTPDVRRLLELITDSLSAGKVGS